ncbi:LysR family transcriptional regulator [Bradyrhizobium sp. UFLA05-112]
MDPKKLLYFASVIESGSLKKAAKELLISQPALSVSIDRLEESVGGPLLERSPIGVKPTPMGEVLYAHARLIRDELKLAESRMKLSDERTHSAVAFGTLPSLANSIVPQAICKWRDNHPTTILRVAEKIQLELLLSLMRGEVDFIVAQTENYGYLEGLKQRVLFRDRLYVISRPDHPVSALENPSWLHLAKFPWIIQMVGRQRTLLEKLLASESVDLPVQLTECGTVNCIKAIVAGSDSLALLPASAIDSDVQAGRIRALDITGPLLNRDIAVIFRERNPLTEASRSLVGQIAAAGIDLGPELNCQP